MCKKTAAPIRNRLSNLFDQENCHEGYRRVIREYFHGIGSSNSLASVPLLYQMLVSENERILNEE